MRRAATNQIILRRSGPRRLAHRGLSGGFLLKLKQWLVFILLGAIWSSSFLWIKIAVQEIGPIPLVAFRALFGLLFGIVVILIQRTPLPRRFKDWVPLLLLG